MAYKWGVAYYLLNGMILQVEGPLLTPLVIFSSVPLWYIWHGQKTKKRKALVLQIPYEKVFR